MNQVLISESDIFNTYPKRSQELARKYQEAIAMSSEGKSIREISNILNEGFELIRNWINVGRKPGPIYVMEKLKEMELLPLDILDSANKKHEMLVKLHAFVHGDGTLYDGQIALYGQEEDLKEIEGELHYIFPEIKTYLRKSAGGEKSCYGTGYLLMVYSAHLARCLIALGAPVGDKVIRSFDFPAWLFDCPENLSKTWLEVFLGNEGTALEFDGHRRYYPLQIQLSKCLEFEENILGFLWRMKKLFSEFGVESTAQKRRDVGGRNKDDKKIGRYYFTIKGDVFNLIRFFDTFKYKYARDKQLKNKKNMKRVKAMHKEYLETINAFLVAKKLRYFGFRYRRLKDYYEENPRIKNAIAWNTFYSYSKDSGVTPRYLNKVTLQWPGKDGTVFLS